MGSKAYQPLPAVAPPHPGDPLRPVQGEGIPATLAVAVVKGPHLRPRRQALPDQVRRAQACARQVVALVIRQLIGDGEPGPTAAADGVPLRARPGDDPPPPRPGIVTSPRRR
jgi:hypothetical protein